MDWVVGLFLAFGLLFFWGVWIFGYWLPMAKEHQRQFQLEAERERRAREAAEMPPDATES
ncbi:MAG: hypothetical protein WBC44_15110 [Planctomycetaceae bacterium]